MEPVQEFIPQTYVNLPATINTDYSRIQKYYSLAGPDYKAWSRNLNMHFGYCRTITDIFSLERMLDNMSHIVLSELKVGDMDARIADLGCGVGTVARFAAAKFPKARIDAITIVQEQVNTGTVLNQKYEGAERISFQLDNFEDLSFPRETFTHAYAIESACHARGKSKKLFIREMARTLKRGGRFSIADGFLKHYGPKPKLFTRIYERMTKFWAVPGFADISLFQEELENNGLHEIQVKEISWRIAPSVCYVPWTCLKFLVGELWQHRSLRMDKERWNNVWAPLLGMFIGLYREHFGYYLISGSKR